MATRMWWDFYAIDQTLVCTLKMAVYILVQCWKCLDENLIIEAWNMHEADLRENERILSKVTDEQAAEFLEKIEQVREEYIHKAEQALPQGENLDMLRDFSEIPERRYRRQEGEIDSDDDEEWHPEADLDGFSDDDLDFIDEYDLNSTEDESSVDPPSDYVFRTEKGH
ncbi:DNA binding [Trichomonas vaginalis G3]|nr:DNA binding [Trichomonas vaginalis G3]KAI5531660.1 DNA binding [Trichomonas vaginalis G3]